MVPPATSRLISVWMRFDSLTSALVTGDAVERRAPAFDVLLVVGDRKLPEIDLAWARIGQRIVQRIGFFGVDAAIDRLIAKHMVDRLQDRLSRAERSR